MSDFDDRFFRAQLQLQKWSRRKKAELLSDHLAEWARRVRRLQAVCEAQGHVFSDYPHICLGHPDMTGWEYCNRCSLSRRAGE